MAIIYLRDGVYWIPLTAKTAKGRGELSWRGSDNSQTYVRYYEKRLGGKAERVETPILDFITVELTDFSGLENVWVLSAYEVDGWFISDTEPVPLKYSGSGFNYGSCNQINVNDPGIIWIAGQND